MQSLEHELVTVLDSSPDRGTAFEASLRLVLLHFKCDTGTLHELNADTATLHLIAQIGLPAQILAIVQTIPVGKGIAGETAARGTPVTMCNLQTDTGGVARPAARQTGVGGALCVPVRTGDQLRGTLG